VHFGKLVGNQFSNAKEVSAYIDQEILAGYQTYSTSSVALGLLNSEYQGESAKTDSVSNEVARRYLESRLVMLNSEEQKKLLNMYANPLIRQQQQRNSRP
jgi:hypothetical protein